jgi:hypothetical protein
MSFSESSLSVYDKIYIHLMTVNTKTTDKMHPYVVDLLVRGSFKKYVDHVAPFQIISQKFKINTLYYAMNV